MTTTLDRTQARDELSKALKLVRQLEDLPSYLPVADERYPEVRLTNAALSKARAERDEAMKRYLGET